MGEKGDVLISRALRLGADAGARIVGFRSAHSLVDFLLEGEDASSTTTAESTPTVIFDPQADQDVPAGLLLEESPVWNDLMNRA